MQSLGFSDVPFVKVKLVFPGYEVYSLKSTNIYQTKQTSISIKLLFLPHGPSWNSFLTYDYQIYFIEIKHIFEKVKMKIG